MDPRDEKIAQLEQENRVLKEELRSAQQKLAIIQSIVNATGVSETVEETEVDEFAVPETVEETEVDGFAATEIESGGGGGAPSGETGSDNGGGPNVETEHTTPSGSGQAAGQQRSTFEQEALPPSWAVEPAATPSKPSQQTPGYKNQRAVSAESAARFVGEVTTPDVPSGKIAIDVLLMQKKKKMARPYE
ncbi:hypothetical protein BSKO_07799 [Bryopsis sp. KO-2023]|nr:hypothetical protein BSKO_07799 [Bryopsis sp. KO-2023]